MKALYGIMPKILSLTNIVLLTYTATLKYNDSLTGCASCKAVYFLPVSDVFLALMGAGASLILFLLLCFNSGPARIFAFTITIACAVFASFLQALQFSSGKELCYYCFSAAIIFYLIFMLLFYQVMIRQIMLSINADPINP